MVGEEDIGYFDDINDEKDKIATDTLPSEDREIQKEVDPSLESTYLFDDVKEEGSYINFEEDWGHCIRATRKIEFEETPKNYSFIITSNNNNQSNIKLRKKFIKKKEVYAHKFEFIDAITLRIFNFKFRAPI